MTRWKDIPDNLKDRVVGEIKVQDKTWQGIVMPLENEKPSPCFKNAYEVVFEIEPFPAPRMVRSDKWAKRQCVMDYFSWRTAFVLMCNKQGYRLQPVLNITFIIQMPKSWSEKKRTQMDGQPHQCRPDRDNLLKSIMDAFKIDDGFVWDGRTTKLWGRKGQIIID
jgi:Holliday junction resolvase RusA-like endonuclease